MSLADVRPNVMLIGNAVQKAMEVRAVTEDPKTDRSHRLLFRHDHKKRSLRTWVMPLLVILAIIFLLPKLVGLLEK